MDIVVKDDSQLLLTQAIEYGKNNGTLDEAFLGTMREQGAAMTVKLAAQYYSVNYEAYLRESANIVMGVCNLGAILWSENDVISLSQIVRQNGLVKIFNKGYQAIITLAEKTQCHDDPQRRLTRKDCAKQLMAIDGVEWTGYREYLKIDSDANISALKKQFYEKVCKLAGVAQDYSVLEDQVIQTAILSMVILAKPKVPMTEDDLSCLLFWLESNKDNHDEFKKRTQLFHELLPAEFIPLALEHCQDVEKFVNVLYTESNEERQQLIEIECLLETTNYGFSSDDFDDEDSSTLRDLDMFFNQ